ncbi:MAG: phytoene/squalene synthase family protein [Pseudolabrys sp.]|nr:phytoene/squalene synthase family protein [Pseudolabrys sp.]
MQTNYEHCTALVREADRDRYLAALFAPAAHRNGLFALYAFNIEIARVRDVAREPMPGEIRLQWWREALGGERASEAAAHPVAAALLDTLSHYGFVSAPLLELIDAHTFDLYDEPMPSIDALELYGIRTQSPVFAMAAGILQAGTPPADLLTLDVSVAYALGHVLSRFGQHAARRQLYLPLDLLDRHGADPNTIFAGQTSGVLEAALAELRDIARQHLNAAQSTFQSAPADILPALLPVALVGPLLRRMERADPFRFEPLPAWRRQWLLWRAARDPRRIFAA